MGLQVHFQPNMYDCGIHTLWHLKHILKFQQVMLGTDCPLDKLRFTDDMVNKCLQLAEEIVNDCLIWQSSIDLQITQASAILLFTI